MANDGSGGNASSNLSGTEVDSSVAMSEVARANYGGGLVPNLGNDPIGFAIATRFGISPLEGAHFAAADVASAAAAMGINISAEGAPDTSGLGAGPLAGLSEATLKEAVQDYVNTGETGDILIGENLERRISGEDAAKFLDRARYAELYNTLMSNRESRSDDAALNTGALSEDDYQFIDRLTMKYGDAQGSGYEKHLGVLDKEGGLRSSPQEFIRTANRVLGDEGFLQYEVADRDFGDLDASIARDLSTQFGYTGDFTGGAFNTFLTEGGDRDLYEAGAAADPRQNLGFNADFNAALLADERFSGFDQDFGAGRFQAWLDQNNLRDEYDDFLYARQNGGVEPGDYPYQPQGTTSYGNDQIGIDLGYGSGGFDGGGFGIEIPELDYSRLNDISIEDYLLDDEDEAEVLRAGSLWGDRDRNDLRSFRRSGVSIL